MDELSYRIDLLETAILCGGLYAIYLILLRIIYPFVSGQLWQSIVGPWLVERYSTSVAQDKDESLPSYMSLDLEKPYLVTWGLLPPPIDELTQGLRDGMLLGVFAAILPEIMQPVLLNVVLIFVVIKNGWRISSVNGSARTDRVFWVIKEILMYTGAIAALQAVG